MNVNMIKINKSYEDLKMSLYWCKGKNYSRVSNWAIREERKAKKYAKSHPEYDLNGRLEDIKRQAMDAWKTIESEYNARLAELNAKFNV